MDFKKKLQMLADNYLSVRFEHTIKTCKKIKKDMKRVAKGGDRSLTIYINYAEDEIDCDLIASYFINREFAVTTKDLKYSKEIKISWER